MKKEKNASIYNMRQSNDGMHRCNFNTKIKTDSAKYFTTTKLYLDEDAKEGSKMRNHPNPVKHSVHL